MSRGRSSLARVWAGVRPSRRRPVPDLPPQPRGQSPAGKLGAARRTQVRVTAPWRESGAATGADLGLGVGVGGVDQGLAAGVAVGPA